MCGFTLVEIGTGGPADSFELWKNLRHAMLNLWESMTFSEPNTYTSSTTKYIHQHWQQYSFGH